MADINTIPKDRLKDAIFAKGNKLHLPTLREYVDALEDSYNKDHGVGSVNCGDYDVDFYYLMPFSDVHFGAREHNQKLWIKNTSILLDHPNDVGAIVAGDILQGATRTSVSWESESIPLTQEWKQAYYGLRPMADAGLLKAMISGNHDRRSKKESQIDLIDILCMVLGVPYSEDSMYMRYKVRENIYYVYMIHGYGGGKMLGGKANNLIRMKDQVADADVYLSGHTHDLMGAKQDILLTESRASEPLKMKTQLFVRCGSYVKFMGYPIRYGFGPSTQGTPTIILSGFEKRANVII